MRYVLIALMLLFLQACNNSPTKGESVSIKSETADDSIPSPQSLPEPLRFVGDTTAGKKISAALDAEGIAVSGNYTGRKTGIEGDEGTPK